jgi:hypothetical protein
MSIFPPERHPILIIDTHAVPARLISLEQLEPVAGRNRQIIDPPRGIKQFQLPLNDAPDLARMSSSGSRISLAEQIRGRLIAKGLNQPSLHVTRIVCNGQIDGVAMRPAIACTGKAVESAAN